MNKRQAWLVLSATMLISLLGTAGIALPYPVLAPYFLDTTNDLNQFMGINPKLLLGVALALYPLGILIGSSFIGALSDHYGRRLVLIITLAGSTLGYLVTAYAVIAESYMLFLSARLVTGICEGNLSIARAMAVDLHPVIHRTKALSMVYATIYSGWLLGPLAGGYLMLLGTEQVFIWAAVALAVCAVIVLFAIKDDKKQLSGKHSTIKAISKAISEENSFRLLKHTEVRPIFIFYFIYALGNNTFYEFYPVWFVETYQFTSDKIAWITVVMTSSMVLSSVFITTSIVKLFGNFWTLSSSVLVLGTLMMIQPFVGLDIIYVFFAFIGFLIALNNTVTPSYMSERFGEYGQGKIMGLQTSIFCLTNVIVAILGSVIAIMSINATMIMAGVLILCSFLWFILYTRKTLEVEKQTV